MRIRKDITVAATASAKDVDIQFRDFIIANNGDSTVYFRDKDQDGEPVTTETGFALPPKTVLPYPVTASTLSIIADGEADVRIMFVDL